MTLSFQQIGVAKGMLLRGDDAHHIAALIGENPARVAEIKAGMPQIAGRPYRGKSKRVILGEDVPPWPLEKLPPPGPYYLNMIAERDIIQAGCSHAAEQLAHYIGRLERERPVDKAALQDARSARTAVHNALLERRRENYKGFNRDG